MTGPFLHVMTSPHASPVSFQVAEQKYESIKSINMALENSILQLRHQVELGRSRQSRRRLINQQDGSSATAVGSSSSMMPTSIPGFSTSPSSPPSFSSISGIIFFQFLHRIINPSGLMDRSYGDFFVV